MSDKVSRACARPLRECGEVLWGEAAWEIGDTHSVYVSASYFTIGQAGGPESSVSSDLEHIAGVTSGLHHQSISPASAGNDRG